MAPTAANNTSEALSGVYESYVDRVRDFRREQQWLAVVLLTVFGFAINAHLQASAEAASKQAPVVFTLVSGLSLLLLVSAYCHTLMVVQFGIRLGRLERQLQIPRDVSFYGSIAGITRVAVAYPALAPVFFYLGLAGFFVRDESVPLSSVLGWAIAHVLATVIFFCVILRTVRAADRADAASAGNGD